MMEDTKVQHRIGVISDTHLPKFAPIPAAVWNHFADVELIIHAGDLSLLSVISQLETIAPVVAVQGNIERAEVVERLPIKKELLVGGCRIGIVHILGEARNYPQTASREFTTARIVVFGHSHTPYCQDNDGQLLFNPGSATDRRRQPTCSIGRLLIDDEDHSVQGEIILL
jgi:hypothetical protein